MNLDLKLMLILRKELEDRKITQKQLAEELDLTEFQVCRILKGKCGITLKMLYKIAKGLHLSIDELLGLKETECPCAYETECANCEETE